MYNKGSHYISPRFKKDDYIKLQLSVNSPQKTWEKAIEIFEDRIENRFFKQIGTLLSNINDNGFTIMAINCLLIETLYQFRNGIDETKNNKESYSSFLVNNFSNDFIDKDVARKFYERIRCGILHSAQTKTNSCLSTELGIPITYQDDYLIVAVKPFFDSLLIYYNNYKNDLRKMENADLRQKFINKMRLICDK